MPLIHVGAPASNGKELADGSGDRYHVCMSSADGPLQRMINQEVVLDTGSPIVYIGTLDEITDTLFVLRDGDMHDCRDGHASKEHYLIQARQDGVTKNRHNVVVMRSVVISVSRLADIVAD